MRLLNNPSENRLPICYFVQTVHLGKEYKYLTAVPPKDDWALCTPLYTMEDVKSTEDSLSNGVFKRLKKWVKSTWWILWTGYPSLVDNRHAIEERVRRFGGTVKWD